MEHQKISIRAVQDSDVEFFFKNQQEPEANQMAAFTAKDPSNREAFQAHWRRISQDPNVIIRTVLYGEQVAGSILRYESDGSPEVSYWIGKEYWGKGIATEALRLFLQERRERPMFARVAKDNTGSRRVLEKCGFTVIAEERGFAEAREAEIDELVLQLA